MKRIIIPVIGYDDVFAVVDINEKEEGREAVEV